jgi:dihydroxyacetone kinase-like protein
MSVSADTTAAVDAAFLRRWLDTAATAVEEQAAHLTELDSPIGDADHGANLRRGFTAVREEAGQQDLATPGAVLVLAGRRLISSVGGASGPLYGTLLRRAGKALGDAAQAAPAEFAAALRAGVEGVAQLGGAAPGDATMLDALVPAVDALDAALGGGASLAEALTAAAGAARKGAEATVPLRARKGRASYLGERSEGHEDPGAASAALLLAALAATAGGAAGRAGDGDGDGEA